MQCVCVGSIGGHRAWQVHSDFEHSVSVCCEALHVDNRNIQSQSYKEPISDPSVVVTNVCREHEHKCGSDPCSKLCLETLKNVNPEN